ncbi:MAG: peptide-methionine (S)-S-oxide reductase [Phascolarctobacterium sp.]|nr:peptide-methionine (S)-S-oxide reductase [Phascolarctobacterium sp.]
MSNIYFAGGYVYDLQEVFSRTLGVEAVEAGYANCSDANATKEAIAAGQTDAALCIKVQYSPRKTDLGSLLQLFFKLINPFAEPTHPKYRTGVYYEQGEDLFQIEYYFRFLRMRGTEPVTTDSNIVMNDSVTRNLDTRPILTEMERLRSFVAAPEEEQFYLRKHPEAPRVLDIDALVADGLIQ